MNRRFNGLSSKNNRDKKVKVDLAGKWQTPFEACTEPRCPDDAVHLLTTLKLMGLLPCTKQIAITV